MMRSKLLWGVLLCALLAVPATSQGIADWLIGAIRAGFEAVLFYNVLDAIDSTDPRTRMFAVSAIERENQGYYNIAQVCDIWDDVTPRWIYVNDPAFLEYVAPASESIRLGLRGDCDDHAVVMAASIRAIGGAAAVVVDQAPGSGHAWPMVYLGRTADEIRPIIAYICNRYNVPTVNVYPDEYGIWLGLDWTADHPGGRRWTAWENVTGHFVVPAYDFIRFLSGYPLPSPLAP